MTELERNMLVGNRIKQARLIRNMTLDEVADEVKVAKSTIQRYETAKIQSLKMPVLEAIAKVLDINPVWLMGEDVPMERPQSEDAERFRTFAKSFNEKRRERIISMNLKDSELELINKYRYLDDCGKEIVDFVISKEYDRCQSEGEIIITLTPQEIRALPLDQRMKLEQYVDEDGALRVARKRNKQK